MSWNFPLRLASLPPENSRWGAGVRRHEGSARCVLRQSTLTREYLARRWPRLYHLAEQGSWKLIRRYGLRSTTALLDLFEVDEGPRQQIESAWRPKSVAIEHGPGFCRGRLSLSRVPVTVGLSA